jgi:AcrR family transcriptional regulator
MARDSALPTQDGRRAKLQDFKRAEILGAAARLLAVATESGFSLRAIAKEAGYSPAALYAHFENIDGLMVALASEGLAALARALKAADNDAAPPEKRLAALIEAACDTASNTPLEAPLIAALADPKRRNRERALARHFNGRLISALTALGAAIPEDGLSRESRAQAGVALAAAVLGLMLFERSGILAELGLEPAHVIEALSDRFAHP